MRRPHRETPKELHGNQHQEGPRQERDRPQIRPDQGRAQEDRLHRLQGRRHRPGRLRPQGNHHRRAGDARPHGGAREIRQAEAPQGRPHHGLPAHDHPDRRAHRDPGGAGRRRALGLLQHLLHPGPCRRRHRQGRRPGLRLEGRDPGGVLGLHHEGPVLPLRQRPAPGPRADRRRRRRRHPPHPLGREGGEGRLLPRPQARLRGGGRDPEAAQEHPQDQPRHLEEVRQGLEGRLRGDDHRRAPPVPDDGQEGAAGPGHQRQRQR